MSQPDGALLERWFAKRDGDAFAEIVSRHAGMVYGTCRRTLRDSAEAEDVAQECFLELAQNGRAVRRSVPGWLHRLALHRSLDRLKSRKRQMTRDTRYAAESPTATEPSWHDLEPLLDQALADLPDDLEADGAFNVPLTPRAITVCK